MADLLHRNARLLGDPAHFVGPNISRRRRTVGRSSALGGALTTASAIWRNDAAPIMPEAPFRRWAARAMAMKSSVP